MTQRIPHRMAELLRQLLPRDVKATNGELRVVLWFLVERGDDHHSLPAAEVYRMADGLGLEREYAARLCRRLVKKAILRKSGEPGRRVYHLNLT